MNIMMMNIKHDHLCVHRPSRLHFNSWSTVWYSEMSVLLSVWAVNLLSFSCDLVLHIVAKLLLSHDYGQIVGQNNAENRTIVAPIKQAPLHCQLQTDIMCECVSTLAQQYSCASSGSQHSLSCKEEFFCISKILLFTIFYYCFWKLCRSKTV